MYINTIYMHYTDQVSLSTDANGVTPIPAATSTSTSYVKMSSLAVPNGPSTATL